MGSIAPFSMPGRFLRGNIHTHTTRSDGARSVEEVIRTYRDAGYDFLSITDHFLERFGFPVTDTRAFGDAEFTLLPGAEIHAPRTEVSELWHLVAVGLPLDFAPTSPDEDGPALARRARAAGAFVGIAHPGWYSLSLADAETLVDAAHSVEIYNHGCHVMHDKGYGAYLLDGLLDKGYRLTTYACDDAHFKAADFGGGWVELKAADRSPEAILDALKLGHFYSTQGPRIDDIEVAADHVEVRCSPASRVLVVGQGYLMSHSSGIAITRTRVSLAPLAASPWLRVIVVDDTGRSAWSNPIWK
ncbi:CehA/McbA family metallohydrolase [Ancylobacter sp. Lp-2]|uniref:CehA/McbA family metallohydrolase n=1 Tax=Ancylobacter sp. Lp-2 TaxID=2881339 RepID=UPI001E475843|nr:CehA/McbA family metallohydrolase [Ancylobacter sp. Lp-2]MCB4770100.1 CehA/McbA family metallohydrolase [Ancylobacter sp. Lp-2]